MCSFLHAESERIIMIYLNSLNNFTAVAASMSFSLVELLVARSFAYNVITFLAFLPRFVVGAAAVLFGVVFFSPSSLIFSGAGRSQILYYICHREVNDFQNGICIREVFFSLSFHFLPGDLSTVARNFFSSSVLCAFGSMRFLLVSWSWGHFKWNPTNEISQFTFTAISGNAQHLPNDEILR